MSNGSIRRFIQILQIYLTFEKERVRWEGGRKNIQKIIKSTIYLLRMHSFN